MVNPKYSLSFGEDCQTYNCFQAQESETRFRLDRVIETQTTKDELGVILLENGPQDLDSNVVILDDTHYDVTFDERTGLVSLNATNILIPDEGFGELIQIIKSLVSEPIPVQGKQRLVGKYHQIGFEAKPNPLFRYSWDNQVDIELDEDKINCPISVEVARKLNYKTQ